MPRAGRAPGCSGAAQADGPEGREWAITQLARSGGWELGEALPIMVDLSTFSVEASRQVRPEFAARGTEFLAAPVMGNPQVAADGARPHLEQRGMEQTKQGEAPASLP